MRRLIAALSAAAFLLASAPAWADGYRGHRYYGHGHYRGHHHGHGAAVVVGAVVGGLVLWHLLARPVYAAPTYYAPPPPPRLVLGNCQATTGTGYAYGRPALYGGTMCFDQYGRGNITPGSAYFIRYLD